MMSQPDDSHSNQLNALLITEVLLDVMIFQRKLLVFKITTTYFENDCIGYENDCME